MSTVVRGRYPWKKWLNGKRHTAQLGKEFACTATGFKNTLYSKAKVEGCTVKVSEKPNGVVEFCFTKA